MNAKLRVAGMIAIGALAGALATIQLQAYARNAAAPLPLEELQQLAAVFGMVKSDYVEPVDEKKLIGDAIAGMVAGLDPHSQYFDKKTLKEFREQTGGRFVGVGIEIGMEDGLVKVQSPIEGSPAFRAGIKSGDLITRIDETPVKGLSMDQAVKRMRGEPNTKVSLTIFRKSENRSFPVIITREEIRIQSVRAKMLEPGYAWLRVSQFQDRTVDDFVRKLEELYKQDPNLKGLVLDLRNDPGGLLDAAVAISAAFLPENVVVVTTNGQIADSKATFKAAPEFYARRGGSDPLKRLPAAVKTVPLVVLVNEGSASASEIVAGALQDHKRATIMGAQTFGKGSVQTVRPLSADTALKITTARYYTPAGKVDPGQGRGARRLARRNRRRQRLRRAAHARGRPAKAPGRRRREEGRSPHQGPRRSAPEARGTTGQAERAAQAAARVRHRRRLPAEPGLEPPDQAAGDGQQDRGRAQGRSRGELSPAHHASKARHVRALLLWLLTSPRLQSA